MNQTKRQRKYYLHQQGEVSHNYYIYIYWHIQSKTFDATTNADDIEDMTTGGQ